LNAFHNRREHTVALVVSEAQARHIASMMESWNYDNAEDGAQSVADARMIRLLIPELGPTSENPPASLESRR